MKKGVMKRWLSIILAIIMIFSNSAYDFSGVISTYAAEEVELAEETADNVLDMASDNGLADSIEDGVILHAWNWSFKQIEAELDDIVAAGYTAVQTSPIQPNKEGSNVSGTAEWWKFYQPVDFAVCNSKGKVNKLGSREDFISLCDEAHKHGIKIVVDVVANHLANKAGPPEHGPYDTKANRSDEIPDNIRNNDSYWHYPDDQYDSSDGDRRQMTRGHIGMPDLNTGNEELQNIIMDFLSDAQSCGADGFRFDAAKHIETPSDGDFASQFWEKVKSVTTANNPNVFLYGEILNTAGPGGYNDLKKYTSYIRVTNNEYANNLREGIKNGDASRAKFMNNDKFGSNGNEWVLWNESHDTYAGDYGEHTDAAFNDEDMALAWCAVAARTPCALYFSRPIPEVGEKAWARASLGQHTDMYKNERIAAVNKFHNYFAGQSEYTDVSDNVLVVERGTSGVALINFSRGSKSVNIKMNKMEDGTYTDQVTGSEFKVSGGMLTGNIGSGGVAVVYNAAPVPTTPTPTISKEGGNFSGDTLTLTIGLKNTQKGTYKIGNAEAVEYTTTKDITIGSDMAFGDSIKIVLTAIGETTTETKEYTFTKVDKVVNKAYLAKPSDWPDTVYCYAYNSNKLNNGEWPGVQMTKDAETGYYVYEIPENIEKPRVIFNCGKGDEVHRDPADGEDGFLFETDGSWLYENGNWKKYSAPVGEEGKVTVKYVDGAGNEVSASKTLKGKVGDSYTTSAADVNGYTLKTKPSNATGKYTKEDITVTYIYEKISDDSITITSSLAEGTTFDTETKTITLTITNATSGTYSVDDGPVKTFTGSADVVIGQGKIADTEVKVDVTATNGTDRVNKTFTYNKKFSGKTANEKLSAASAVAVSMELSTAGNQFASEYYKTNPSGRGTVKTITGASDWTASELIAQGVANDDSNVLKGPHEYPVYDAYALYGAYDNDNVYLGWQFVNVRDVVASDQQGAGTNEAKPYNANIPQMLVFDLGSSIGAYADGSMDEGDGNIWGIGVNYSNNVNAVMCFDSKPGCGDPALFTTDSNGKFSYGKEYCKLFKGLGITYEWEDGLFAGISSLYGINKNGHNGLTPDMFLSNNSDWEDLLAKGHKTSLDTMYTIKIPYSALGITKEYIQDTGIGVMHISTFGLSGVSSIPADDSMFDNATEESKYGDNTTLEKEDVDVITAPLARLGGSGDTPPPPPIPTDDLTVNFGADRSSPQLNTTKLTLKAIAKGGKAPYKYEFSIDGNSVQSESAADSYEWTPSEGTHAIAVKVTDSEGTSVYSQKIYTIEGEGEYTAPEITEFKVSKESATEGEAIKLSASATGGQGTLEYKFTATDANGNKTVISEYSTAKFADWAPSAGTYKLEVTVKDEKNIEVSKAINGFVVAGNVVEGPKVKSISIDKDSATEGDSVKISAVAEGTGELQYHFTVTAEGGEEIHIQEYDTLNECNWTAATAGTYTLTVYVKDGNGKTAKKSRSGFVVNKSGQESNIKIDSFTPSKASGTAKAGESIELSVNVTSNVEVTYRFAASLDDNVTVISDYSNNSKVTWNPQVAGDYDLYVYVKDAEGHTVTKVIEGYKVNPKGSTITLEFKDFTTDKYSAIVGDTVKLTATAEGEGLQYRFAVTAEGSKENIIQDYSTSNTCNWKASAAGTYTLAVSIKDSEGHMVSKEIKGYKVNPKGTVVTLNVKSISADKDSGTAIEGDTVKISVTAEGKGELQYRFTVTTGGAEEVIQDYSTSSTCSWKTDAAGTYTLSVYVKDGDGNIVKKSKNGYIVNQKTYQNTIKVSSFTADKASGSIIAGDSVKLSVKATAQNEITYRFTVVSGDTETIISNYSQNSTVTWRPETAGTYSLFVYVKDEEGNVVSKEIEGYTVKDEDTPVYEEVSITSFKTSKASNTVTTGQSVKMTAKATGGSGQLMYQFVVKLSNGKSKTVRKYSSNNSCQWKPTQSGKYTLYVYVKDSSTGKIVKKSIKNYNVKQALKIKSFTQSRKSGTALVGDKIVVKVNATGGIGKKFYKYYYKLNGKKYILKNYTANNKINWTPKKAGKYQLFVEAVDDVNNKVTKKVNYVVVNKLKVKTFKATPTSVKAGRKVKLSVSATGGTKKYSYKFKYTYKNKSVVIRTYSGSSKVTWTPRNKGKYKLTVYVKDAKNRKTTKTMTLNVK